MLVQAWRTLTFQADFGEMPHHALAWLLTCVAYLFL